MMYLPIIDVEGMFYYIFYILGKDYEDGFNCKDEEFLFDLDTKAVNIFQREMRKIFEWCGKPNKFLGFTHGTGNYRKTLDITYKSKRPTKPEAIGRITKACENRYKLIPVNNIEVDDACSISLIHYNKIYEDNIEYQPILVSADKDLLTIPGHHLRPRKNGELEYIFIDEVTGTYNLMYQMIVGDTADGVKGIEGLGEVAANKILGKEWIEYKLTDDEYTEDLYDEEGNCLHISGESIYDEIKYEKSLQVLQAYIKRYGEVEGCRQFSYNFIKLNMLRFPMYDFVIPELTNLVYAK